MSLVETKQTKHIHFINCCGLYDSTGEFCYLKDSHGFSVILRVKPKLLSMSYEFPRDLDAGP